MEILPILCVTLALVAGAFVFGYIERGKTIETLRSDLVAEKELSREWANRALNKVGSAPLGVEKKKAERIDPMKVSPGIVSRGMLEARAADANPTGFSSNINTHTDSVSGAVIDRAKEILAS